MPGVQLYSGNYLSASLPLGKGGAQYGCRHGFCLETQVEPNAVNVPAFHSPVLEKGGRYHSETVYKFSVKK